MSNLLAVMIGIPVGITEISLAVWALKKAGVPFPIVITPPDPTAERRGWTRGYADALRDMREEP